MNALDRLKAAVASDLATPAVSAFDLALVLAVVDAANWYMDDASKQTVAYLRKALEALTEDKP